LAVIGDLRSIARLSVLEVGVRSIGALFEVSSLFRSFLSPASPPLMVISLAFLPLCLSCSVPCNFSLGLVVSSLALLTIIPESLIPFLSIPFG